MGYAFISYDNHDRDFALRLAQDLEDAGCDVWLDKWNIVGRDPFWDEIQVGIEKCSDFIFVVSPHSVDRNSGAYTELLHVASLKPKPTIVPVMAIKTPFTSLPLVMSPGRYQIQDFTRAPYSDMLRRVVAAISPAARFPLHHLEMMEQSGKHPRSLDDSLRWLVASRERLSLVVIFLLVIGLIGAFFLSNSRTVSGERATSTLPVFGQMTSIPTISATSTLTPLVSVTASIRSDVFLRAGPGMTYRVMGVIRTGEQVSVIGRTREGWLLIQWTENTLAWLWSDFVDLQPAGAALPALTITPRSG